MEGVDDPDQVILLMDEIKETWKTTVLLRTQMHDFGQLKVQKDGL